MALEKKTVTGMRDILPGEMEIRDYCIHLIEDTYRSFGFTHMETPCVESLTNLNSKAGGENEKLIFKILKRGEKFKPTDASTENDLADGGLRYDLTVPLVRYYSAHQAELPTPFKALQMGNVWRADRPQKGRFRQFMQCDIDILGEETILCETELITATSTVLGKLGFKDFLIRINDRRILKAMAAYSGFAEDEYDTVFISLDKMDKIGAEGVLEDLEKQGFPGDKGEKFLTLFSEIQGNGIENLKTMAESISEYLEAHVAPELQEIIETVEEIKEYDYRIAFDPTLVRGMSYYTGPIFEVSIAEYGGSCGGGGRYDGMVGRFTGKDVPACGFSIGFERIIMLITEHPEKFNIQVSAEGTAFLLEKGLSGDQRKQAMKEAEILRKEGKQVLVVRMNKNKKFQKDQLKERGYSEFKEFYVNPIM